MARSEADVIDEFTEWLWIAMTGQAAPYMIYIDFIANAYKEKRCDRAADHA